VAAHAGGVVLEVAQGGVQLVFLDAFQGKDAGGLADAVDVAVVEVFEAGSEPLVLAAASMNSRERARSCRCSRAWNRSTIWVASGNFAVAMPQIQAAPSPRMVNCRTWSAPRRMPSAFTRFPNAAAGSKVAMTLVEARSRTG
jgi:hypothetical protein